jgi:carbon monoxide dehydrogenase subunit G
VEGQGQPDRPRSAERLQDRRRRREGGVAGFAKGSADVRLSDKDGGTLLTYSVDAQIGGKLAQLGQRLINGAAKKMADEFFQKFAASVTSGTSTNG